MLIPSIDLRGGRVVQLVQGRREALAFDDVFAWVARFAGFPRVQLIDLDGALGTGANDDLVRAICGRLPCRVGGGIRDAARAGMWLDAGAAEIIVGSSFFTSDGVDEVFAASLAAAIGAERIVGALDSAAGRVVVRGWRESTTLTAEAAARALDPHCGGFLYTHVDTEGLMGGIDMEAVRRVRASTTRPLSAAGGITTDADVAALDAIHVDAVVGMAIYTGRMRLQRGRTSPPPPVEE